LKNENLKLKKENLKLKFQVQGLTNEIYCLKKPKESTENLQVPYEETVRFLIQSIC
jgi:hypothetical protein